MEPSTELQYESTVDDAKLTSARPIWVWVIVGLYTLLVAGLVALATAVPIVEEQDNQVRVFIGTIIVLMLCGIGLVVVPIRAARRRPMSKRALWIPVLAAVVLGAVLVFGATIALAELAMAERVWPAVVGGLCVWLIWGVIFTLMTWRRGPQGIANALHRWILAGSVLELLIAVPTHVAVRRRDECCAGIATGLGLCLGIAVMILAFGPSVVALYYKRWNQVSPRSRSGKN